MFFIKCKNSTLYVGENGERYIKCKKLNDVCCCQRYCTQKRNYELTPSAENCKINPKNIKVEKISAIKKEETKIEVVEKPSKETKKSNIEVEENSKTIKPTDNKSIKEKSTYVDKEEIIDVVLDDKDLGKGE